MTGNEINLSSTKGLGLAIAFIALTNIAILLDIPILRQISGFIFLTFIPGFLLMCILKQNKLGLVEKIVLSVGLSVAFTLLFGLVLNSSLLAVGYTRPLSTFPLLISFNVATIVMVVVARIRHRGKSLAFFWPKLTLRDKASLILPATFPLLSIVGMRLMNTTDNNVLLMLLFLLIPAYIIFLSFHHRNLSPRLYPCLIYLISISLVLVLALRSNHIIGSDIHDEYYIFLETLDNAHWRLLGAGILDSCLSISILPTVYQTFLNMNPEYLFKIVYPILFSFSPLVVYIVARKYVGRFYAFLAAFFFMSQILFLWSTAGARTVIALLFFALSVMVLFHDEIRGVNKRLLFLIFAISCVVSHYGITYVFLFIILFTWIGMQIIPRLLPRSRGAVAGGNNPPKHQLKGNITMVTTLLFLAVLFFWYSQVTISPFYVGVVTMNNALINLSKLLAIEAKGTTVTAALGGGIHLIPQWIRVVVSWLTVGLIGIGVLYTLATFRRTIAVPGSRHTEPDSLHSKFEMEYFIMSLVGCTLVVISVILPLILMSYSMERIFSQLVVILSPFLIIGGTMVAKWLRTRPQWIILLVLIPFFMCSTGTMYQLLGAPASMALNSEGTEYELWYTHDQDSYAAKWVIRHTEEGAALYAGAWPGPRVLQSQGSIPLYRIKRALVAQERGEVINGYIYLRYADVVLNRTVTDNPDIFVGKNKIYTTGDSEVYR